MSKQLRTQNKCVQTQDKKFVNQRGIKLSRLDFVCYRDQEKSSVSLAMICSESPRSLTARLSIYTNCDPTGKSDLMGLTGRSLQYPCSNSAEEEWLTLTEQKLNITSSQKQGYGRFLQSWWCIVPSSFISLLLKT